MGKIALGIFIACMLVVSGIANAKVGPEEGDCVNGKLIKVINKNNVEEVKDYLPPTVYKKVKEWGLEFNWVEGPYEFDVPEKYKVYTEKFKGTPTIDQEGSIQNYSAGLPFPDIDPDDPRAALKIMWNFSKKYQGDDHYYNNSRAITLDRKMRRRFSGSSFWLLRNTGRTILPPLHEFKETPGVEESQVSIVNEPEATRGSGMLKIRYIDPKRENSMWFYVPSLRRVVRASAARGQESMSGTDTTWDDTRVWAGRIEEQTYKLLAYKKTLQVVCEMKSSFKGMRKDVSDYDDSGGFLQGGNYQLVDTWIIETKHVDPTYIYSKSVYYIDPKSYEGFYAEMWDRKGRLYKCCSQRLTYNRIKRYHYGPHWEFNDFNQRHFTNWVASDYTENHGPSLSFYSLETLRRMGR